MTIKTKRVYLYYETLAVAKGSNTTTYLIYPATAPTVATSKQELTDDEAERYQREYHEDQQKQYEATRTL
jgi:hypothetical protein